MDDTFKTIAEKAEGLYKEKGSKFIAYAYPIAGEEEAKELVQGLKKEFYDARHRCYAYRIGPKGESFRMNDDGEPSSTAGRPIYGQLLSFDVTNILVVVIRYFGGTKLGVSGLINAYQAATSDALQNAAIVEKTVDVTLTAQFGYPMLNEVMKVIKDEQPRVEQQSFDNSCTVRMSIRKSRAEVLEAKLASIDGLSLDIVGR
ncbi:YigZ family protein [uncultured Acetobacteroides sp.]|uniref:IMPACT family protein n=1 Tax=uncultured Acetobacteroides sp. TaxID=1760811 RepID=UPI0029F54788|nr:YigZ family protein [uncultured Acetobacteroides sp.]